MYSGPVPIMINHCQRLRSTTRISQTNAEKIPCNAIWVKLGMLESRNSMEPAHEHSPDA